MHAWQIIDCDSQLAFEQTALKQISGAIHSAIHTHGQAVIGLSGGSTPMPIYRLLREEESIDWEKVTIFLVDERFVSASHKDSNQLMIRETLLASHQVEDDQIFFPDTSLPPDQCIKKYNQMIAALDHIHLVILGMGADGHIASLFPPLTKEANGPKSVIHTTTERFAVHDRISVTLPVLARADKRIFLISGEQKMELLKKMEEEPIHTDQYPAQALMGERTTWICGNG